MDIERVKDRMWPSKSTLSVALLIISFVVVVSGSAVAIQSGIVEDFEDGDVAEWEFGNVEVTQLNVYNGSNSGRLNGSFLDNYPIPNKSYSSFETAVLVKSESNLGGANGHIWEVSDSSGNNIMRINMRENASASGVVDVYNSNNKLTQMPIDTWIIWRVDNVDYVNDSLTIELVNPNTSSVLYSSEHSFTTPGVSNIEQFTYRTDSPKYMYFDDLKVNSSRSSDSSESEGLLIETRDYLEHNTTVPFRIYYEPNDSTRINVTSNATVSVENTSVVTVDQTAGSMASTNDTSINQVTWVNATYDGENANHSVVVSNETIENVDILPPMQKWTATIGDDNTLVIIVATAVAAGVALYATSLAGLGAFALVIIGGWLGGFTADHTVISAVLVTLFVGLNVSQLVEFDRR